MTLQIDNPAARRCQAKCGSEKSIWPSLDFAVTSLMAIAADLVLECGLHLSQLAQTRLLEPREPRSLLATCIATLFGNNRDIRMNSRHAICLTVGTMIVSQAVDQTPFGAQQQGVRKLVIVDIRLHRGSGLLYHPMAILEQPVRMCSQAL